MRTAKLEHSVSAVFWGMVGSAVSGVILTVLALPDIYRDCFRRSMEITDINRFIVYSMFAAFGLLLSASFLHGIPNMIGLFAYSLLIQWKSKFASPLMVWIPWAIAMSVARAILLVVNYKHHSIDSWNIWWAMAGTGALVSCLGFLFTIPENKGVTPAAVLRTEVVLPAQTKVGARYVVWTGLIVLFSFLLCLIGSMRAISQL